MTSSTVGDGDGGVSGNIRRLDETVVNRIAAGEVVQRPASALKELLENSLDAGATRISVTARNGGLKLLTIQDDGRGISRHDLAIVCERFTTSKLTQLDDLLTIGTFGFRGEALASISHVARVSITTRTTDSRCAYRASYMDGTIDEQDGGGIRACAGNVGTLVSVEDMFYNMVTRRQALRSFSEEFSRLADVVARYAVHRPAVAFSLRKHGDSGVHVRTTASSSHVHNIAAVFGARVAANLHELHAHEPSIKLRVDGCVSSVNYSSSKLTLLLFINERLVECGAVKRALELVYAAYLPRGSMPFAYVSLQVPGDTVDVNVHPTKHEVHLLHEQRVVEFLQQSVDSLLLASSSSRSFYTQTLLPGKPASLSVNSSSNEAKSGNQAPPHPSHTVRVDHRDQKLDRFVVPGASAVSQTGACVETSDTTAPQLSSVIELQQEVEQQCDAALRQILAQHSYVGTVNTRHALVQHNTRLYLLDHQRLAAELFRQLMLYQLGRCGSLQLDERPSLRRLALLGLQQPEAGWTEQDGSCDQLAEYVSTLLTRHSAMLLEYFSVGVDEQACLSSLPLLLPSHRPSLAGLPLFVVRLATEVEWTDEKQCLAAVATEIGRLYSSCAVCQPRDIISATSSNITDQHSDNNNSKSRDIISATSSNITDQQQTDNNNSKSRDIISATSSNITDQQTDNNNCKSRDIITTTSSNITDQQTDNNNSKSRDIISATSSNITDQQTDNNNCKSRDIISATSSNITDQQHTDNNNCKSRDIISATSSNITDQQTDNNNCKSRDIISATSSNITDQQHTDNNNCKSRDIISATSSNITDQHSDNNNSKSRDIISATSSNTDDKQSDDDSSISVAVKACRQRGDGRSLPPEVLWHVEHVLMPACRQQLLPPVSMSRDGVFLQLADLPDLYKIFERC